MAENPAGADRFAMLLAAHTDPEAAITIATQAKPSPGPMGLPVLNIGPSTAYTQSIKQAGAAVVDTNQVMQDALTEQAVILNRIKAQQHVVGQAKADEEYAKQAQAQQVADIAKKTIQLFGADTTDSSSIASQLALQIQKEREEALNLLDAYNEKSSVSVLDNPLQFLVNAFDLPAMASEYNNKAARVDNMRANLDNIERKAKDFSDLNRRTVPSITQEQAAAVAKQHLADAEIKSSTEDLKLVQTKVSYAQQVTSNLVQKAHLEQGLSGQQLQAGIANYHSRVEAIRFAESTERRAVETERAVEMLNELKVKRQAIRIAATALGHDPAMFPLSSFEKLPPLMQLKFMSGGLTSDFGVNPYDAWKNLNAFAGPQLAPTLQAWRREIGSMVQQIVVEATKPTSANFAAYEKDKDGYVTRKLVEKINSFATTPVTESNSFLKELPPAGMALAYNNFTRTAAGTILKSLVEMNDIPTTATVVDTIAKGIGSQGGSISQQSQAIAEYYRANVIERNRQSNSEALKIKLPTTYPVMLPAPRGGGSVPVDLTKPEQIQLYLIRRGMAQGQSELLLRYPPTQ